MVINMKNKVLQTIKKHQLLQKDMHIIVGLSGGPDSVCLFDILRRLSAEMNWRLYAVHVNHKLRPGAAEEDQCYVEELCRKAGVTCCVFVKDCSKIAEEGDMTSEEAGRKARYEAFSETALRLYDRGFGIPKGKIAIALAHNANDQCETILFRLLRGTGTDGLSGIAYKRFDENGFAIVRPILDLNRDEIETYCRDRNLSPCIDHTNGENIYTRNKIRNMLIPYMQENFNPNIIDTVNRMGKIAAEDRDFLRGEAKKAYEEALCDDGEALQCKYLRGLHKSIRLRVYTVGLEKIGMQQNMTFAQAEGIDALLFSESPSAMCNLTEGFCAERRYDKLLFCKKAEKERDKAESEWHIIEMNRKEYDEYRMAAAHTGKIYGAFSGVKAKELCLRTRKEGDKINVGNGSKKLKDFFVDEKVPKMLRSEMLLLAKGSEILWVLPSEFFKKETTRRKGRFSANFKASEKHGDTVIVLEKL